MSKVTKQVEVEKEADELAQGILAIIKAVKDSLSDGWQPGTDMPKIMIESATSLVPAIQGIEQLPAELKEDKAAFGKAFALAGFDIVGLF